MVLLQKRRGNMFNYHSIAKRSCVIGIIFLLLISGLMASELIIRMDANDYQNAPLKLRNEIEIIGEENGIVLARCAASTTDLLNGEAINFETIESYDHLRREDLPPMPEGGIPLAMVVDRGSQGEGGWHDGVAMAGDVLAYMETNVEGQLPGFTFWDMNKDSVWHHYIDTDLDSDQPLYMKASDSKIYYTFHYTNPAISNSDMRYYWYDAKTDEHGEVENFGYGFEGFGVSDKWMMRVGNSGMGWNNQIYACNMETGVRFSMLADSSLAGWGGYQYDNFGGIATDGNTMVFTYTDNPAYVDYLKVYSLGADGIYGTADDIGGTLSSEKMYGHNGPFRIEGRYIVWQERTDTDEGDIKAYDMGEDELYGTDDDGTVFDICVDADKQANPRIDDGIIIWEDWRNVTGTSTFGEHDIYGYDLSTDTEFRSTARSDSLVLIDLYKDEVVMIKRDWDEAEDYNDIYFMNITGRIQSDYYRIYVLDIGEPLAKSYLTGETAVSPYYFNNVLAAAKGPLCAVFIIDLLNGEFRALSYSAVTGDWSLEPVMNSSQYTLFIEKENGMILAKAVSSGVISYKAWTFNGLTGAFSSSRIITKPKGFAVGKNMSFIWGNLVTGGWLWVYDAERDYWYGHSGGSGPQTVIHTQFSDSLGILIHGTGDTVCTNIGIEVYDLELHAWTPMSPSMNRVVDLDRHNYEDELKVGVNAHFAVIAQENDYYNNYVYTYSTGDNQWKSKFTSIGDFEKPLLGENFIVQGVSAGDVWQGYIFNDCKGEWLPDYIESRQGIDGLLMFDDLMIAWSENQPWSARTWAYSSNADGIQERTIQYPGDDFTVKAAGKAGYVYSKSGNYTKNHLHVFNGIKGEWKEPLEVAPYNQFVIDASGHTGIFLEKVGSFNGADEWKAHGYSALKDEWDILEFRSSSVNGIYTSDFCGMLDYDNVPYATKYIHAFNGIEGEWSEDIISMYNSHLSGFRLDDRIMIVTQIGGVGIGQPQAHMFSPFLNLWSSTSFADSYTLDGYFTTPTSAFAWDNNEFKIIFSTQTSWDLKHGQLNEIHVTDYAIAATLNSTTHYFYPPRTEIIDKFEFTEGPNIDVESSWAVEVTWKTNKYSDTRLIWGYDGLFETIQKDTLEPTKDHRVLIEGLEAQKTYYYGAISIIEGVDTVHSDTLAFNTGVDNVAPVLVGPPEAYRIHDNEASVWWTTNEPSTAILQWGLTSTYTDTLEYNDDAFISNALRMYDLAKDTTYHYRVGGYDRYGNGPFFSGDYTFRTHNALPIVTDLTQADSTLWGAAYMTWEPPRLDSTITKESFDHGIPVDWKIYNLGDNKKGTSWTSGYSGNNPVAYCNYGNSGERQEEWLITNPITIDGTTGGVLNFWHQGFYTDYDNAPNKVMVSWTGTDPGDFTTVWSSQTLPDDWALAQVDLNYSTNYGKTFYLAFVYESTYGEIWMIDNIYMDFDMDGYYEDFNYDNDFWTQWSKEPAGSAFGLRNNSGNYCLGAESYETAPDSYQEEDSWAFSPFIKITESHHLLGFWQMGWWSAMDNAPNEVRVATMVSTNEASSTVVRSIYPVPEGWQWVTVDLSQYIGTSVRIVFRYHSYVGWLWNGLDWSDWYGETWYIDDMYLFENAPAMVADPNAKPNEKPLKFASSPNGKPIDTGQFKIVSSDQVALVDLASEAPEGRIDLPKEKPLAAMNLPKVNSAPAPSVLAEPQPELLGYEVYGRYLWETYFTYLGYVTSPSFVDWGTYLGYESEYYVEAVYDMGNSQPSNKAIIKGGTQYAENEYGYDTGILYYSYWWYPGTGFINEFHFADSVLTLEKIKVHIAKPGSFKLNINYTTDDIAINQTTSTINASEEGWYLIDPPVYTGYYDVSSRYFIVEFLPQDTLVQLSYDDFDCGYSWFDNGSQITPADVTFYIRLIGEKSPFVAVADIPEEFNLGQNYPNPFNPTTKIPFQVPEACDASVKVYDIRGALVKTLMSSHMEAGYYNLVWNGTNSNGNQVASGVYLIKMTAGEFSDTRKMVLVR